MQSTIKSDVFSRRQEGFSAAMLEKSRKMLMFTMGAYGRSAIFANIHALNPSCLLEYTFDLIVDWVFTNWTSMRF